MTKKQKRITTILIVLLIIAIIIYSITKKQTLGRGCASQGLQTDANGNCITPNEMWDGKFWTCNSNQNMVGTSYNILDDNSCRECTEQEVLTWNTYVANYTGITDPAMQPQPTNCYWKTKKKCREAGGNGMPDANNNGIDYLNMCQCNEGKPENCDL